MEWHTMRNLGRCYFRHLPALVSYIFLVLFSYVLTQVADPEQSNSLWSTDWLRGERGTLHFSSYCSPCAALTLPAQADRM